MLIQNPAIDNPYLRVYNGGAEFGTDGWIVTDNFGGGTTRVLSVDNAVSYTCRQSFRLSPGDNNIVFGGLAQPVVSGQNYLMRVAYRSNQVWPTGLLLGVDERDTYPAGGYNMAGTSAIPANLRTGGIRTATAIGHTIPVANEWNLYSFQYTPQANVRWATPIISPITGNAAADLWFEWLDPIQSSLDRPNLIAEVRGCPAAAIGNTLIYTVQQNKSLIVDRISLRVNTATGTITAPPTVSIGTNSPSFNNVMAPTAMTNTIAVGRVYSLPIVGSIPVATQSTQVIARVSAAAVGATALTYDISLYGQII